MKYKPAERIDLNRAGIKTVRIFSTIVDYVVMIILLLLLVYGCYATWDAKQVHSQASASQYEQYKPMPDKPNSFKELQELNPEVFAWLTVYGTEIDYPVAQGKDNQKYINTDITGNYSAAGSIFLDSKNKKDFSDFNSIIYGHHMNGSSMFGDLDKFVDEAFFDRVQYANLYYDGKDHGVEFFAYIMAEAYDWKLYNPGLQGSASARREYLSYLNSQATYTRKIGVGESDHIILLSTCASEPTNGRHVLVGRLTDETFADPFAADKKNESWIGIDAQSLKNWAERIPYWGWITILILFILILILLILFESFHSKKKNANN